MVYDTEVHSVFVYEDAIAFGFGPQITQHDQILGDFYMAWRIVLSLAFLGAVVQPSFAQDKTEKKAPAKVEMLELADGKIVVAKPEAWKVMPPKSNMIQHEFRAPAEGEKSARITIMSAGGSTEDNIKRWIGQFDGAKKEDTKVESKDVDKTKVSLVEISGTFKESMGGPFAPGGQSKKMENYKMLGAILELKDGAKVFIKATGPSEIIADMKEGFVKMIDELKNK